jgi:tetratricopeptide (TPR) repeat protein
MICAAHSLRRLVAVLAALLLLAAIGMLQRTLTGAKDPSWFKESLTYLPQSERLKPYLLGYETTFANYLWIRTVLYFGHHYQTDNDYSWLISMVDMVTRLNPQFYPAYEFAGLMLPEYCHSAGASRVILERGISSITEKRWKLLYYLSWLYYREYGDRLRAAECLERAAHEEEIPPLLVGLAATYYSGAGDHERGVQFLQTMYRTTENPQVKRYVEHKLQAYVRAQGLPH